MSGTKAGGLKAIKSGKFISALDFAHEMGVSHATIHNYIKQLKIEYPEIFS